MTPKWLTVFVVTASLFASLPVFAQSTARPAYDPAIEPVASKIFMELLSPY